MVEADSENVGSGKMLGARPVAGCWVLFGGLAAVYGTMLALGLVVYWPILSDFFVFDDFAWLNAASNRPGQLLQESVLFPCADALRATDPLLETSS